MDRLVLLAHGASGSAASMQPWVEALAERGTRAAPVQLPRGSVERALPAYRAALDAARDREGGDRRIVIGGHSFGGRVASLLAAERDVAGLLLLSYPLHRPGHPDTWDLRTAHWPAIGCAVLLLSGGADPFSRLALLEAAVGRLPSHDLVIYPRLRHGLAPVRDAAADRIAAWVAGLPA
jgi:predicted alpha/beta-hydrolase family hydrolase